ncbi:hypothetical protein [Helicobacter sp.]|uniref:hypothetical protein n=1 Tax=Helicobacter sp. TaxID=218 RepID=UPI002A919F61|nr:hypothetical protein [Helicobacter sp.]MDY5557482.1 hypothetical protein [Helicobacter sp.]
MILLPRHCEALAEAHNPQGFCPHLQIHNQAYRKFYNEISKEILHYRFALK